MNRQNQIELQAQESFVVSIESIKDSLRNITSGQVSASLEKLDAAKNKILKSRDNFPGIAALPALNKLTHKLKKYLNDNKELLPEINLRRPELLCPEIMTPETIVKLALDKHLQKDDFQRHSREHLSYILELQKAIKQKRTLSAEKYDELCNIQSEFVELYKATVINTSYQECDKQLADIEAAKEKVTKLTNEYNERLESISTREEIKEIQTLLKKISEIALPSIENIQKVNMANDKATELEKMSKLLAEQTDKLAAVNNSDDPEVLLDAIKEAKNTLASVNLSKLAHQDQVTLDEIATEKSMQCVSVSTTLSSLFDELEDTVKALSTDIISEYYEEKSLSFHKKTKRTKNARPSSMYSQENLDRMLNPVDSNKLEPADTQSQSKSDHNTSWLNLNTLKEKVVSYKSVLPETIIQGKNAQKEAPKAIETAPAKHVKKHAKRRLVTIEEPKKNTAFEYQFGNLSEEVSQEVKQSTDRSRDSMILSNSANLLMLAADHFKDNYRAQLFKVTKADADTQVKAIMLRDKSAAIKTANRLKNLIEGKIKSYKEHVTSKNDRIQQIENILIEVLDQKISIDELANDIEENFKAEINKFNKEIDDIVENRNPNNVDVEKASRLLAEISQKRADIIASVSQGKRVVIRCNSPELYRKFNKDVASMITKENAKEVLRNLMTDLDSQKFNIDNVAQDINRYFYKLSAIEHATVKMGRTMKTIDSPIALAIKKSRLLLALNHESHRIKSNTIGADKASTEEKLSSIDTELKKENGWLHQVMEAKTDDDLNNVMENILSSQAVNQRRSTAFNQSCFGFLANLTHTTSHNNLQKEFKTIRDNSLTATAEITFRAAASAAA